MMNEPITNPNSTTELAAYLLVRRETLLNRWRTDCEQDASLNIIRRLSREEFNDMIIRILDVLSQRLRHETEADNAVQLAAEHGLHRWQNGYSLVELLKEVRYLQMVLIDEVQRYHTLYPATDQEQRGRDYKEVTRLAQDITEGSVAQYANLDKNQALGRAQALEEALLQVNELAQQRSDLLRTSSHDLRSSFGVIQSAAFLLDLDGQNQEQRAKFREMMNRNLTNVQQLLVQLMDMARLEAGQEPIEIKSFDVALLIREIVESATPVARQQKLTLLSDGPDSLIVEGDSVKVHRIVQNLLSNAFHYTSQGIVTVTWVRENDSRWLLSIQDTGPGLPIHLATGLFEHLKPNLESPGVLTTIYTDSSEEAADKLTKETQGEGIGLRIVKQLCELLEANMDIETRPGAGSLFRIRFPMHYQQQ